MVVLKGFSPNEFVEWEDSHTLCSNTLSPSGSVMITITITITITCPKPSPASPDGMTTVF